jgi:hypothetical protein
MYLDLTISDIKTIYNTMDLHTINYRRDYLKSSNQLIADGFNIISKKQFIELQTTDNLLVVYPCVYNHKSKEYKRINHCIVCDSYNDFIVKYVARRNELGFNTSIASSMVGFDSFAVCSLEWLKKNFKSLR